MRLKYELKFFDYWHLSSGLSAGAKLDSTVVKDENTLPYASGKTIKGLLREMLEDVRGEKEIANLHACYFTNAVVEKKLQREIISNQLEDNLYDIIASTQIDNDGISVDNSLREIEVVVPLSLHGEVRDVADELATDMIKAFALIKRMGLNRNRGLGRCEFSVEERR